ncbi:hypothetical protein [Burkholderia gladioli]|uniref:hypothetical protein n=1 Tax=Burkholderia gladioli TaxID=28095 RepID=UPI00163FE0DC|nr:hypothetical protein [Burkholderia gladioli]
MNQPSNPVSLGGLAANAQANAANAQIGAAAHTAILATLIATLLQKDREAIETFRDAVHRLLSATASTPAEASITQQVVDSVDAIIDVTQAYAGN